jgi:hypothetical protein
MKMIAQRLAMGEYTSQLRLPLDILVILALVGAAASGGFSSRIESRREDGEAHRFGRPFGTRAL